MSGQSEEYDSDIDEESTFFMSSVPASHAKSSALRWEEDNGVSELPELAPGEQEALLGQHTYGKYAGMKRARAAMTTVPGLVEDFRAGPTMSAKAAPSPEVVPDDDDDDDSDDGFAGMWSIIAW